MSAPPSAAGKKGSCPKCGQRLQIPAPPNKTILAKPVDSPIPGPTPPPLSAPSFSPPVRRRPSRVRIIFLALGIVSAPVVVVAGLFLFAYRGGSNGASLISAKPMSDQDLLDAFDRAGLNYEVRARTIKEDGTGYLTIASK